MFRFLRRRLGSESLALWLALLYAFGTPIFFRTAFLNQNVIIAHLVLIAYVCMVGWRPRSKGEPIPDRNAVAVGALMGFAVLTDYSGVPFLLVFGVWLLVEPAAGDRLEDNLNPVGRAYYGFSTLLCTPASLSQPVGAALGTQAGPARIRDVTVAAGFRGFRLVASTPFINVFEVRP